MCQQSQVHTSNSGLFPEEFERASQLAVIGFSKQLPSGLERALKGTDHGSLVAKARAQFVIFAHQRPQAFRPLRGHLAIKVAGRRRADYIQQHEVASSNMNEHLARGTSRSVRPPIIL